MNILRSVEVEGFWGTKTFTIDFHPDVNLVIGVNGSGKTTLINMIAAALNADLAMLDRLPFEKLVINLTEIDGSRKPSIEIQKNIGKESAPSLSYGVRAKASDQIMKFELDDAPARRIFSSREHALIRERFHRTGSTGSAVLEHLRKLIKVSWLSIHRAQAGTREDRGFESTVDKKLDQMGPELVKYFSLLTRQAEAEQTKFQEAVFMSLIAEQTPWNVIFTEITKLNLEDETSALVKIFEKFGLDQRVFAPLVEKHFAAVRLAIEASSKGFTANQLSAAWAMDRIHSLVREWKKFIELQRVIYEPREAFLDILNRMMVRKRFRVSEKNELVTEISDATDLNLTDLSSGEKQLLIILGEALLQQKSAAVYIADEPELSLHIAWQEQIITNLRSLNPHAQILFATHSPDIVSSYGNHVFNMETYVA